MNDTSSTPASSSVDDVYAEPPLTAGQKWGIRILTAAIVLLALSTVASAFVHII